MANGKIWLVYVIMAAVPAWLVYRFVELTGAGIGWRWGAAICAWVVVMVVLSAGWVSGRRAPIYPPED